MTRIRSFKRLRQIMLGEGFLEDDEKQRINDYWEKNPDKNEFSDHAFGEGSSHVRIPLKGGAGPTDPHPAVKGHLEAHGWSVHDYGKGLASHDESGRIMKIGKVLQKTNAPEETKKRFVDDPARTGSRGEWDVHISRHPHDVGRASVNQSWTSCLNLDRCGAEVQHGSHVAYLTKKDDHEAEHPRARVLLKKLTNMDDPHDHVLRPEMPYGNPTSSFHETVRDWSEKHFPFKKGAHYKKSEKVYNDQDSHIYGDWNAPMHPSYEGRETLWHENMAARHDISSDKLSEYLSHDDRRVRGAATGNPKMEEHHFDKVLQDETHDSVKMLALLNKKAGDHHITQFLTDKSVDDSEKGDLIRARSDDLKKEHWRAIATHAGPWPNIVAIHGRAGFDSEDHVDEHHIGTLLDRFRGGHLHDAVVHHVLSHPKATDDHRKMALDKAQSPKNVAAVMKHDDTKSEDVFNHYFNHTVNKFPETEKHAFENRSLPDKYMDRAKKSKSEEVRSAAAELASNSDKHSHHLDHFMNDKSEWVRSSALSGENVRSEHIDKAITDSSPMVREMAVDHPKANRSHLEFVSQLDPDEGTREMAHFRLKMGDYHE